MEDTFGERLARAIAGRNMTQAQFADELGVPPPRVSEWITGKWLPKGETIVETVAILNIDGHWLLTGDGTMDRRVPTRVEKLLADLTDELRGQTPPPIQVRRKR